MLQQFFYCYKPAIFSLNQNQPLNQVLKYIRLFYQKEFNLFYFLLVLIMLGCIIYLNYWQGLEKKYAAGGETTWQNYLGYYLLYAIPFVAAFFLQPLFYSDCSYFSNKWFWTILLLAPAFFSFRVNFSFHQVWVNKTWQGPDKLLYVYCINWIVRVIVLMIPVILIWWIKDRGHQPFYGIKAINNLKPYLIMLLVMLPVIALASTQKDFLQVYPKTQLLSQTAIKHHKDYWCQLLFELCYGFDFLCIEFFFRGFLILALIDICGTHCIVPMACFYCAIHLGKPMGEAISSFWGGLLLGIISYNTGSIWGSLIVHLGIALMMETGGWLGNLAARIK